MEALLTAIDAGVLAGWGTQGDGDYFYEYDSDDEDTQVAHHPALLCNLLGVIFQSIGDGVHSGVIAALHGPEPLLGTSCPTFGRNQGVRVRGVFDVMHPKTAEDAACEDTESARTALIACVFLHVKYFPAKAQESNALLGFFAAPLRMYLLACTDEREYHPDLHTLLMALVVWGENAAGGVTSPHYESRFDTDSEQQRIERWLLASYASAFHVCDPTSEERRVATELLVGHVTSGSAAGFRFFAWLLAHSWSSPSIFRANVLVLIAALSTEDEQAVLRESGSPGDGVSSVGIVNFVESFVCSNENTIRLLAEILCDRKLVDPHRHATVHSALCVVLRRRPVSAAVARVVAEIMARCSHAVLTGCHLGPTDGTHLPLSSSASALIEVVTAATLVHADVHLLNSGERSSVGMFGGWHDRTVDSGAEFFPSNLLAFLTVCLRAVESRGTESIPALSAVNAVLYIALHSDVPGEDTATTACMPSGLLTEVQKVLPTVVQVSSAIVSEWSESCDANNGSDGLSPVSDIVMAALGACALVAARAALDATVATTTKCVPAEMGDPGAVSCLFNAALVRCLCEVTLRASCSRARQLAFEAIACITAPAVSSPRRLMVDVAADVKEQGASMAVAFSSTTLDPLAPLDMGSRRLLKLIRASGRSGMCNGDTEGEREAAAACLWGALEELTAKKWRESRAKSAAVTVRGGGGCLDNTTWGGGLHLDESRCSDERDGLHWEEMLIEEWLTSPSSPDPKPCGRGHTYAQSTEGTHHHSRLWLVSLLTERCPRVVSRVMKSGEMTARLLSRALSSLVDERTAELSSPGGLRALRAVFAREGAGAQPIVQPKPAELKGLRDALCRARHDSHSCAAIQPTWRNRASPFGSEASCPSMGCRRVASGVHHCLIGGVVFACNLQSVLPWLYGSHPQGKTEVLDDVDCRMIENTKWKGVYDVEGEIELLYRDVEAAIASSDSARGKKEE